MEVVLIALGIFLLLGFFIYLIFLLGRWIDRYRIIKSEIPPHWLQILENHFPGLANLDQGKRSDLLSAIQIYMAEKDFIGKDSIQVTDEMRILLSMQLITMAKGRDVFLDKLREVYIYPAGEVPPLKLAPKAICLGFSLPLYSNQKELDLYFLNRVDSTKKRP